jgi:hypothetical protein
VSLYDYVASLPGIGLVLVLLDIVATFVNQNKLYRNPPLPEFHDQLSVALR